MIDTTPGSTISHSEMTGSEVIMSDELGAEISTWVGWVNHGAAVRLTVDRGVAAGLLDEAIHAGEAQPSATAGRLGRKEGAQCVRTSAAAHVAIGGDPEAFGADARGAGMAAH